MVNFDTLMSFSYCFQRERFLIAYYVFYYEMIIYPWLKVKLFMGGLGGSGPGNALNIYPRAQIFFCRYLLIFTVNDEDNTIQIIQDIEVY